MKSFLQYLITISLMAILSSCILKIGIDDVSGNPNTTPSKIQSEEDLTKINPEAEAVENA